MYKSKIDENAELILRNRYYQKDKNGKVRENWDKLCTRVVKNIVDKNDYVNKMYYNKESGKFKTKVAKECYDMIYNLDFLPNSPTLSNAGTKQCLSACFVCPLENNLKSVFKTIHDTVLIHKSGGGTGFNFSKVKMPKILKKDIKFGVVLDKNHDDYNEYVNATFSNLKLLTYKDITDITNNNITVIINIKDTMDDIFNFNDRYRTIKNVISDYEQFTDNLYIIFDFSLVRSKDSLINTTKTKASGPVSFMKAYDAFIEYINNDITPITTIKLFDRCTESVKQGGMRRGANMGILNHNSEFIEEFINCKKVEGDINNFNLSVGLVNGELFIENKENIRLKDYSRGDGRGVNTRHKINRKYLFNTLIDNAWNNGEPGIIFLDKVNAENPIKDTTIEATNPCFTGNMRLLTNEGYKTFKELCDTEPIIITEKGEESKGKVWCSGTKEVVKLTFDNGKTIECTHDHIFRGIDSGKQIKAKDLIKSKERIAMIPYYPFNTFEYIQNMSKCPKCIDIENIGFRKVYDFEEPLEHWGIVEDFVVHNCGEQPLLAYESCNLGSINLVNMISETLNGFTFDWSHFDKTIDHAVLFLDCVIDANNYPLKEIELVTKKYRKIGLGVMGLADCFALLDIPYDSDEALAMSERIASFLETKAHEKVLEIYNDKSKIYNDGRCIYNHTVTTIAPTGTLSTLANVSSGIEPFFSVVHKRTTLGGEKEIFVVNPRFKKDLEAVVSSMTNENNINDLVDNIIKDIYEYGIDNTDIPDYLKNLYKSASNIDYRYHIAHQDIWQRHIDNAISKTINFANEATREDVAEAYKLAYKGNCKGITVYRDGSRDHQILNTGNKKVITSCNTTDEHKTLEPNDSHQSLTIDYEAIKNYFDNQNNNIQEPVYNSVASINYDDNKDIVKKSKEVRARHNILHGYTKKIAIGCGSLYVTVNFDDDGLREIFVNNGKGGGCASQTEATTRLFSTALKYNIPYEILVDQLKGIRCPSCIKSKNAEALSCPDAIIKCVAECMEIENSKKQPSTLLTSHTEVVQDKSKDNISKCPECGNELEFDSGCVVCRSCGWSKCH